MGLEQAAKIDHPLCGAGSQPATQVDVVKEEVNVSVGSRRPENEAISQQFSHQGHKDGNVHDCKE